MSAIGHRSSTLLFYKFNYFRFKPLKGLRSDTLLQLRSRNSRPVQDFKADTSWTRFPQRLNWVDELKYASFVKSEILLWVTSSTFRLLSLEKPAVECTWVW